MSAEDRKYHTKLTDFVERKWRTSGKTQPEFIETLLDADPSGKRDQTLSKFIRGRLASPPPGLIEALARQYNHPVEELEWMAVTPLHAPSTRAAAKLAREKPVEMAFVFGHTVWAGSFLISILDKDLQAQDDIPPEMRIASWKWEAQADEDEPTEGLCWHPLDELPTETGAELLAAPAVIKILESPESSVGGKVTFGILPWYLVAKRQKLSQCKGRYLRLATLMDSAVACSVILPKSNHKRTGPEPKALSSSELADWLVRDGKGKRNIILAEQGTVAGNLADKIVNLVNVKGLESSDGEELEIAWDDIKTSRIEKASWQELLEKSNDRLAAVIAWDPQATLLTRGSKSDHLRQYPLLDQTDDGEGPARVTFDIVLFIHEDAETTPELAGWRRAVERAAECLFYEILPKVQKHQQYVADLTDGESSYVETLGKYFGFKDRDGINLVNSEIARIFSNIRYHTTVDPQGMASALKMLD